jgi:histidinol-phosphate aminotransferase
MAPAATANATPPALRPTIVLDCAYAPLRLSGNPSLTPAQRARVWQLWSPNKSLGLTGLRAAYAIAPEGAQSQVERLDALAPSWPIGAHGEAMLLAWAGDAAQSWLTDSLTTLIEWKAAQVRMLQSCGWDCTPSDANFFCARPPRAFDFAALRGHGVKLRDASSFGLPGWARLSVQPPQAQAALLQALNSTGSTHTAAHATQPQGQPKV